MDESVFHDPRAYYHAQVADTPRLWRRLGGAPNVAGLDVLDFGCGHGALSRDSAERGARSVLGVDLSEQRIRFARDNVQPLHPDVIRFELADVRALPPDEHFDVVISKDTFEHVSPLPETLSALVQRLRPAGRLVLGFSPLWYSPWGDHGELGSKLPWAHVFAGEKPVLARFNERNASSCTSLPEAGYNMLRPRDYFTAFASQPLVTERLAINPHEGGVKGVMMDIFRALRAVPGLEPYTTVGIYGVWRKT
ncbi:MAG: SAM-dependent methyltransferase [Hyphomicrobiaceae bacterium]